MIETSTARIFYCVVSTYLNHQVSENKMFRLNESLEINTKKLCNLNESSDKSAKSLQVSATRERLP